MSLPLGGNAAAQRGGEPTRERPVSDSSGRLPGRHVLLTGAGGWIGLAVAEACIAQGAVCSIVDRAVAISVPVRCLQARYPGRTIYIAVDITDAAAIVRLLAESHAAFGLVHTLFNNAAVFDLAPLLEADEASFDKLFAVNVKAFSSSCKPCCGRWCKRRPRAPASSIWPLRRATKAAVISHTQRAALAMAPHGIRVNARSPGVVDTPMWAHVDSLFAKAEGLALGEKKHRVGEAVPLGHMVTPQDIAGAAVFLASDEARYITAQTLNVDGGHVMS